MVVADNGPPRDPGAKPLLPPPGGKALGLVFWGLTSPSEIAGVYNTRPSDVFGVSKRQIGGVSQFSETRRGRLQYIANHDPNQLASFRFQTPLIE